ncbi:glycoside hydrolase family 1 protein [Rhodococcus fascians]|nr:glycoside hydrolase family 1 protein [Rhodococcus fascians]MBY3995208.1 glycoside hydrolase family 1 protein [Rhodococcus fascians]MBY4000472.1 glycoside hydrolase family 1 protein [Rhodococcus fascians]MBY4005500.1 glycoside hydrolase family 1 protein [Rhodococcus fascians]MBY4016333.1 glycoside hydrolase family 1 protein [Rhodococcus fascians]
MTNAPFPDDFLWGTAHAGHQVEGDNVDSDTWFVENLTPTVFAEPSGKAVNNWELWSEDIDLAHGMGLNAYRFSVEWSRVEPVEGKFSTDALDHYESIVDRCLELGLAPIVTLNHFTCPHWFAMRGSWLDTSAPDSFARYCDRVIERFGDRIAYAITVNEPNLPQLLELTGLPDSVIDFARATLSAAAEVSGVPRYGLANIVPPENIQGFIDGITAGHIAARAVIKARYADLPVGLSLAIMDDVVVGDDPTARDGKRVDVYRHWLELAREDDFIGVQNYEQVHFDGHGVTRPPEGAVTTHIGTVIDPLSLAGAVRYAYEEARVPVMVTEHGMSTPDDTARAAFIEPSLRGLQSVIDDGVPVLGYLHWSLLDNFEWTSGFGAQYGLVAVDRETFVRTPKPSAAVYAAIARGNSV